LAIAGYGSKIIYTNNRKLEKLISLNLDFFIGVKLFISIKFSLL